MRTNIVLDDKLIEDAMAASGHSTKKATVEEALRLLVRHHRQKAAISALSGIGWEGDLAGMRADRSPGSDR